MRERKVVLTVEADRDMERGEETPLSDVDLLVQCKPRQKTDI